MQLTAGAVAHELPHHRETGVLAVGLDSLADVANAVARNGLLDALIKRRLGHIHQALCFEIDFAHRIGAGIVAVESVDLGAGVNADDVARANDLVVRRDTMNNGIVQADASRAGEAVQALEVGLAAVLDDKIIDDLIQFPGGHTSLDVLSAIFQGSRAQGVGPAHSVQFFRILDLNHFYASKAFITSAVVASMDGLNGMTASLLRSL